MSFMIKSNYVPIKYALIKSNYVSIKPNYASIKPNYVQIKSPLCMPHFDYLQARVSARRISRFLKDEELDPNDVIRVDVPPSNGER